MKYSVHQRPFLRDLALCLLWYVALVQNVPSFLQTCEKIGRSPQKPYSGKLMLRIPSEVHARAAMLAEAQGKSLNQWAADVFKKAN